MEDKYRPKTNTPYTIQVSSELYKKGKWVTVYDYCNHKNEEAVVKGESVRYLPSGMANGAYCSQCWCRVDYKSNFCPHCGAKMEVGE